MDFPIGELARRTDVKVPTIRYYERIGLLRSPAHEPRKPLQGVPPSAPHPVSRPLRCHLGKADTVSIAAIEADVPLLVKARVLLDRFHSVFRRAILDAD